MLIEICFEDAAENDLHVAFECLNAKNAYVQKGQLKRDLLKNLKNSTLW